MFYQTLVALRDIVVFCRTNTNSDGDVGTEL
jgi:hypothetical protein